MYSLKLLKGHKSPAWPYMRGSSPMSFFSRPWWFFSNSLYPSVTYSLPFSSVFTTKESFRNSQRPSLPLRQKWRLTSRYTFLWSATGLSIARVPLSYQRELHLCASSDQDRLAAAYEFSQRTLDWHPEKVCRASGSLDDCVAARSNIGSILNEYSSLNCGSILSHLYHERMHKISAASSPVPPHHRPRSRPPLLRGPTILK